MCGRSAATTGGPIVRFGHVVTVHAVDVQQLDVAGDPRDVGREVREVGGEDRRRDFHRRLQRVRTLPGPLQHEHEHAVGARGRRHEQRAPAVPAPRRAGRIERDEVGELRRGERVDRERLDPA